MRTFSGDVNTALASGSLAIVQLIGMQFTSGSSIWINLSNWDLTWLGRTYQGAAGVLSLTPIDDKPGEVQGIGIDLFGDTTHIALALDAEAEVQGSICEIRTAIIETVNYTVLDAPVEWAGILDTMSISEDGQKCVIHITAESRAVDLLRGNPWTYNDADQRVVNPTDGSFRFVQDQIDKPVVWPSREYFQR